MPFMSAPAALLSGLLCAQFINHPYPQLNHKVTSWLLKSSVIGLGFGMNIFSAFNAGKEGILLTVISIFSVLALGFLLGKVMKNQRKVSFLISAGTAICGGSAIAALSPVMKAREKEISVSLGIIFFLNAIALLIFPPLGHALHLTQSQFGMWCALAIHDTSSVVGAASKYGEQALEIATTVKLARALWIVPVSFFTACLFNTDRKKVHMPWFIAIFILVMVLNTFVPFLQQIGPFIVKLSKQLLHLTLFFIGTGLSLKVIRSIGIRPFLQGVLLWAAISGASLWAIVWMAG